MHGDCSVTRLYRFDFLVGLPSQQSNLIFLLRVRNGTLSSHAVAGKSSEKPEGFNRRVGFPSGKPKLAFSEYKTRE